MSADAPSTRVTGAANAALRIAGSADIPVIRRGAELDQCGLEANVPWPLAAKGPLGEEAFGFGAGFGQ